MCECKIVNDFYRHKTCLVVVFVGVVLLDVSSIVGWSCLCCCWWLKKLKWLGVWVKLNMILVVGEVDISGTVVVFVKFGFDKNMGCGKREVKSSDDDVGENPMDWENCEANDDGERQLVSEEPVSLNFDECVISIGADCNGRPFGSSEEYEEIHLLNFICIKAQNIHTFFILPFLFGCSSKKK